MKLGDSSIALTKGTPYFIFMKQVIFDITEKGQLQLMNNRWAINKPDCTPLRNKGKPLSIQKLFLVFTVCMIGILFTLVTLFVERWYFKPKKSINSMKVETPKIEINISWQKVQIILETFSSEKDIRNGIIHLMVEDFQNEHLN